MALHDGVLTEAFKQQLEANLRLLAVVVRSTSAMQLELLRVHADCTRQWLDAWAAYCDPARSCPQHADDKAFDQFLEATRRFCSAIAQAKSAAASTPSV